MDPRPTEGGPDASWAEEVALTEKILAQIIKKNNTLVVRSPSSGQNCPVATQGVDEFQDRQVCSR
jgi:hypothetical protein